MIELGGSVKAWDPGARRLFWIGLAALFIDLALTLIVDDPHPTWFRVVGLMLAVATLTLMLTALALQKRAQRAAATAARDSAS